MKITSISAQVRNPDRVNISIDGKYRFSLDIYQLSELGIKAGQEIDEVRLTELFEASNFGKLYTRALEYSLVRPRSTKEIRDYLYRKTRATKYRSRKTGEVKERDGYAPELADLVLRRLTEKGYINDEKFARFYVENRQVTKGISRRKLTAELRLKGIEGTLIEQLLIETTRNDGSEIAKIIAKKRQKYGDDQKMMAYLARQGFSYDDIKSALGSEATD